jgi:hypothetical protein
MSSTPKRSLLAPAAALGLAACLHAPPPATPPRAARAPLAAAPAPLDATAAPRRAGKVLVTGSRIPLRLDARGGLPATISPVTIHTPEELLRTGIPDRGAALYRLDPSLGR